MLLFFQYITRSAVSVLFQQFIYHNIQLIYVMGAMIFGILTTFSAM